MPEIISRKEARALGLRVYFSGLPCPHGHNTLRSVSTFRCVDCKRTDHVRSRETNPFYRIRKKAAERRYRQKMREEGRGEAKLARASLIALRELGIAI